MEGYIHCERERHTQSSKQRGHDEVINIEKDRKVRAKKGLRRTVKRARTMWRHNKYQERQENKERRTSLNSKNAKDRR